jgi:HAD superfamily hydrolase (TIGR01509 family)
MPALIYDCDGVLADTERYGHLPAFNQMFEEFGVPVRWSEGDYAELLKIGGGKERVSSVLTPAFVEAHGLPTDPEGQADLIARWHRRKTDIYTAMVDDGALPPRAGVRRLSEEAADGGWQLAVASTSAERSVRAVLAHAVGSDLAQRFSVFAGDVVARKKPAPDIYQLAVSQLRVPEGDGIAVEDSHNGLVAALGAELSCVVTTSSYTRDEDFAGASLVVTTLGDPDPRSAGGDRVGAEGVAAPVDVSFDVIADPAGVAPQPCVRLDDLRRLLDAAASTRSAQQGGARR